MVGFNLPRSESPEDETSDESSDSVEMINNKMQASSLKSSQMSGASQTGFVFSANKLQNSKPFSFRKFLHTFHSMLIKQ